MTERHANPYTDLEAAEIAKFTKTQYEAYEDSLKVYRDWQNTISTAN